MNNSWSGFVLLCIILIFLQVWVFSEINLFQLSTPYFYPVLLLFLPISLKPTPSILIGFCLGLILDFLLLTPGLHTSAMTATAFARGYLLRPFLDVNMLESWIPVYRNLGKASLVFLLELLVLHHLILYALDAAQYFSWEYLPERFGAGLLFSYLLAVTAMLFASIRISPQSSSHGSK